MEDQDAVVKVQVRCVEGTKHPVRLKMCEWGSFEVVYNPCEDALGVFGAMSPCSHLLTSFKTEFLADRYAAVRRSFIQQLSSIQSPDVTTVLIDALNRDEDRNVRHSCAEALGEMGDPKGGVQDGVVNEHSRRPHKSFPRRKSSNLT